MASPNRESEPPVRFYRFGEFELDLAEETLRREGAKLPINHRMFQVLRLLIERRGEIVSKDEFFEKVWGGSFVEDNNLTVTVTALRKVLGDDAKKVRFIENLPRKGYRFIAPLGVDAFPVTAPKPHSKAYRSPFVMATAGACVIIALTIAALGYRGYWRSTTLAADRIESIAILPFESRDPDSEYLADGLTDGIINGLSRQSGFRVIDRNSAYQYKNKSPELITAGRELNVEAVVTGQLERVDEALIITAELTDLAGNSRTWRRQFRRSKDEIYAVQQEIVQAITSNVLPRSAGQEQSHLTKRPTNNSEAYDLYLKGRYHWNKRANRDLLQSIELFRSAIDKDPTFARAYVGLADAYALVDLDNVSIPEKVKLAQGAIQKALEIDDTIGEAYAAIGISKTFYDWDLAGAESAYLRALELDPNDATTHHWYAELLAMDGRFDESNRQYDIALSLDPLSLPIRTDTAFAHYAAHDFDAAIEILNKAKEIDPEYERTYIFLGFAYREKGMFKESVDCQEKAFTLNFQKGGRSQESYDGAMKFIADLRKGASEMGAKGFWQTELKSGPPDLIYKAVANSKLGENTKTFEYLEKAFRAHYTGMVWLKVQPDLDGIRPDPRYQDLLRRVGFRIE